METTMEFSFLNIRSKLAMIDFFERVGFGFAVWCLGAVAAFGNAYHKSGKHIYFRMKIV